jgi:hypothetical protein
MAIIHKDTEFPDNYFSHKAYREWNRDVGSLYSGNRQYGDMTCNASCGAMCGGSCHSFCSTTCSGTSVGRE